MTPAPVTPATTCPLLWDGARFRHIVALPDIAEWDGVTDAEVVHERA